MTIHTLRLALCSAQANWGGGEQFLWSLGNQLIAKGHEIHWFAPQGSSLEQQIQKSGQVCNRFPCRKFSLRDLQDLRKLCLKLKIQVFHSNDPHALNWGGLALLGLGNIRRVAVKHTTFPVRKALKYNLLADVVTCVSNAVQKRCLEDGIWAAKTRVIYAGAEVPDIDTAEAQKFVHEQLNVSMETPVFSAVGNLFSCKAYDRLIEATSYLRQKLHDFRIVICGDGPERENLQSLINQHDVGRHVKLLGFRNDANRWIAGSHAFVHPSLSEGLSLVAVQAQLLGVPVVAAKTGGLAEVLTAPGTGTDLGWIIQDPSPESLAQRMLDTLVQDEARTMKLHAARELALERFGVGQMADNYERLYLRLCQNSAPVFSKLPSPSASAT